MTVDEHSYVPSSKKTAFAEMESLTEIHNWPHSREQIVTSPDLPNVPLMQPLCIQLREHCERMNRKIVKSKRIRKCVGDCLLCITGDWTYEMLTIWLTEQTHLILQCRWKKLRNIPSIDKVLQAINVC